MTYHRLQWLARGPRDQRPRWLTNGQDGNWPETMIKIQHTSSPVLVERTNPAAPKPGSHCRQQDISRGSGSILQTIELTASLTVSPSRLLGIGADDDNNRCLVILFPGRVSAPA